MAHATEQQVPTAGLLLAAGKGRRMGMPKALLRWRGRTFVEHIATTQHAAGLLLTCVVAARETIAALQESTPRHIRWVEGDPEEDPISSLQRGVGALKAEHPCAVLVGPIDQGPYPAALLDALLAGFDAASTQVRIPTYQGKPGHPVLLGARFLPRLQAHPQGLRGILQAYAEDCAHIEVSTAATLRNLNHKTQYERFLAHPDPLGESFFEARAL